VEKLFQLDNRDMAGYDNVVKGNVITFV